MAKREKRINFHKDYGYSKPRRAKGFKPVETFSYNPKTRMYDRHIKYVPKERKHIRAGVEVTGFGIFRGVLLVLLVFMIVGVMTNGDSYNGMMSFRGFMKVLQDCPMIPTDWLSFGTLLPDSVRNIPFIGGLIELITQIVSVIMFFVVGIANAIWILLYFLGLLFGIAK